MNALPIPGFPAYRVDAAGVVYGKQSNRPLRPWVSAGYLTVGLRRDGRTHRFHVHRLVLMAFVGPGDGLDGCHNNGDRMDNRLENLRWGTRADNIRDQVRHGTHNNARKTHCKRGHEFTPENTYLRGNRRQCVTCTRQQGAASYLRKKGAA